MAGKAVTGPGGTRFSGMPARGESSQALLGGGGGGPGRQSVSLVCSTLTTMEENSRDTGNKAFYTP
jgi:hypothetical protein